MGCAPLPRSFCRQTICGPPLYTTHILQSDLRRHIWKNPRLYSSRGPSDGRIGAEGSVAIISLNSHGNLFSCYLSDNTRLAREARPCVSRSLSARVVAVGNR